VTLTDREIAVLRSWWRYRMSPTPEREVARELGISQHTVKVHLRNVRAKCGVHWTWQAALVHVAGVRAA
jgi:DNA-binding CsgD family transcriptional regulator